MSDFLLVGIIQRSREELRQKYFRWISRIIGTFFASDFVFKDSLELTVFLVMIGHTWYVLVSGYSSWCDFFVCACVLFLDAKLRKSSAGEGGGGHAHFVVSNDMSV